MIRKREDIEREKNRAGQQGDRSIIGVGGAIFLILAAGAIYLFVTARPDEKPVAPYASKATMSDSTQCDRLVEISRREGIVKSERSGNRIRVDESRWAAMTDDARRNLMQYVSCAAYSGRGLDALDAGEAVLAISAASGKLLAKAGPAGIEPATAH